MFITFGFYPRFPVPGVLHKRFPAQDAAREKFLQERQFPVTGIRRRYTFPGGGRSCCRSPAARI